MDRFFYDQTLDVGCHRLIDAEAHHLINVVRAQLGDEIEVFNGTGKYAAAVIREITKKQVKFEIGQIHYDPEPEQKLILAVAPPKGDRLTMLIEKATELGVSEVHLISTARTIVQPREGKLNRLEKIMISACKQSRRNHLMKIVELNKWSDFVQENRNDYQFLADPGGVNLPPQFSRNQIEQNWTVCVAIGPEGGFTPDEIELAMNHGYQKVSLGTYILRVETAAISAAALLCSLNS